MPRITKILLSLLATVTLIVVGWLAYTSGPVLWVKVMGGRATRYFELNGRVEQGGDGTKLIVELTSKARHTLRVNVYDKEFEGYFILLTKDGKEEGATEKGFGGRLTTAVWEFPPTTIGAGKTARWEIPISGLYFDSLTQHQAPYDRCRVELPEFAIVPVLGSTADWRMLASPEFKLPPEFTQEAQRLQANASKP